MRCWNQAFLLYKLLACFKEDFRISGPLLVEILQRPSLTKTIQGTMKTLSMASFRVKSTQTLEFSETFFHAEISVICDGQYRQDKNAISLVLQASANNRDRSRDRSGRLADLSRTPYWITRVRRNAQPDNNLSEDDLISFQCGFNLAVVWPIFASLILNYPLNISTTFLKTRISSQLSDSSLKR